MGKYDDIDPDALRADLIRFARLLLRLDREGALLERGPEVQEILGELRRKLFAYEVRCTSHLSPPTPLQRRGGAGRGGEEDDPREPHLRDSLRIVREALAREAELRDEWEDDPPQHPPSRE